MGKTSFYSLTISDIRQETSDTVSIALSVPQELKSQFDFVPGQYITFKAVVNGEEVRRAYSLCSSPDEEELRVAVKKVENGTFSSYANEKLKVGDSMEVMPPMGNFQLSPEAGKSYLAIAAGSGITPIMSMIKTAMDKGAKFTLLYGSKSVQDIIFKSEIDALKTANSDSLNVRYILSRTADEQCDTGRIDADYIKGKVAEEQFEKIFICGPEQMIEKASDTLVGMGYQSSQIVYELFSTPVDDKVEAAEYTGEKFTAEVVIILDDEEETIQVDTEGDSILEKGLVAGLDLPFACKGGVCCTCKCQVKEGEVAMDLNYSLDKEEVEEGYVLACQSRPRTKKVVLDFDV